MAKPLTALVGRPNVGKSTLFNRLVGERVAIIEDLPGTTRDRLYGEFEWRGRDIAVVDTGGIVPGGGEEEVAVSVFEQAAVAVEEADLVLFMVDSRSGVMPVDAEIADLLRRSGKPLLLVVNKADNVQQEVNALEFHELGMGEPIPISAGRGLNTGDLLDAIVDALPPAEGQDEEEEDVRIAIVGRPNVGKSSLVNALTGEKRVVVSHVPGTTRDAVDTRITRKDKNVVLVDTAGIRRRGKIQGIERYSVLRAFRAIDRADVAVLLIDATEPFAAQDAHVAGFVHQENKGLIVAVNKWDLVTKDTHTMSEYERALRQQFSFMPYVPIVFISAVTGQRIEQIIDLALSIREERRKRITTGLLNQTIQRAMSERQPPSSRGKLLKVFYMTQVGIDPPTFVIWVNDPELVHFSYRRYLENRLREKFGFFGTPIRVFFRARGREREKTA